MISSYDLVVASCWLFGTMKYIYPYRILVISSYDLVVATCELFNTMKYI